MGIPPDAGRDLVVDRGPEHDPQVGIGGRSEMATLSGSAQRLAKSLTLVVLFGAAGQSGALGAGAPCRVRNVTQDTRGHSLVRMVDRAKDGDRLRMRGTCPGRLRIHADIDLQGIGERPAITGRRQTSGVVVTRRATVTLRGLAVRLGRTGDSAFGGGIHNMGDLTAVDVTIRHNWAGYGGGGIANHGTLALIDSTIADNRAGSYGGGIFNYGTLMVTDSQVSSNRADNDGGGIANVRDRASVTLDRSTISGNTARFTGGGILNTDIYELEPCAGTGCGGTVTLISSTVTGNAADFGGGIMNDGGGAAITLDAGSSVTGNVPDDCVNVPAC
jgi:hypothetical protein